MIFPGGGDKKKYHNQDTSGLGLANLALKRKTFPSCWNSFTKSSERKKNGENGFADKNLNAFTAAAVGYSPNLCF